MNLETIKLNGITLNRALGIKNDLVRYLRTQETRLKENNSYTVGNTPAYDAHKVLDEIKAIIATLVKLKAAISVANLPKFATIVRIGEIKSLITTLGMVPTEKGKKATGFGEYRNEETYIAIIEKQVMDKHVEELHAELRTLNDEMETFNHTTTLQVVDEEAAK